MTKILFYCQLGLDSFLNFVPFLDKEKYEMMSNESLDSADVAWLEWCDPATIKMATQIRKQNPETKIIMRLHSYEAFCHYPAQLNPDDIDVLVFVSESVQSIVSHYAPELIKKSVVIPNGIDVDSINRMTEFDHNSIAVVSSINDKKNPAMVLQIMNLFKETNLSKIKAYWAGAFQDIRYNVYLHDMRRKMGLEDRVEFLGHLDDIDELYTKHKPASILHTSLFESQCLGVMEAMARGVHPVIHDFYGAGLMYPESVLFKSCKGAFEKICESRMMLLKHKESFMERSEDYAEMIRENYNMPVIVDQIERLFE